MSYAQTPEKLAQLATKPVSAKQHNFITSLMREREIDADLLARLEHDLPSFNAANASKAISWLVTLPKKEVPQPVTSNDPWAFDALAIANYVASQNTHVPSDPDPASAPQWTWQSDFDPGVYDIEPSQITQGLGRGKYAAVSPKDPLNGSQSVRVIYATGSGVRSRKATRSLLAHRLNNGATKLSTSEVTSLGKQFGVCMCCARLLSDPTSVANGIGPVCAKRYGYATA